MDNPPNPGPDPTAAPLTTQRVLNAFSNFGDGMVRSSGIGEFVTNWPFLFGGKADNFITALNIVAQRGWAFQQHSLSLMEDQFTATTFERSTQQPRSPICAGRSHTCRVSTWRRSIA